MGKARHRDRFRLRDFHFDIHGRRDTFFLRDILALLLAFALSYKEYL